MNFLPPLVNSAKKIIFINLAVFLFFALDTFFLKVGLVQKIFILKSNVFQTSQYWQFFTYFFFHTDLFTLFFEMILVYFLAYPLEQMWGERNFLIFYFTCGVVSGILSVLFINLFGAVSEKSLVYPIYGSFAVGYSIITVFSLLYKDRVIQLLLFFVLPVSLKGKYILYISIGFLLLTAGGDVSRIIVGLSGVVSAIIFLNFLSKYLFGGSYSNGNFFSDFSKKMNSLFAALQTQQSKKSATKYKTKESLDINTMNEVDIERKIDELLEIISQKGFKTLTKEQRDFLLEASKKYKHKFPS